MKSDNFYWKIPDEDTFTLISDRLTELGFKWYRTSNRSYKWTSGEPVKWLHLEELNIITAISNRPILGGLKNPLQITLATLYTKQFIEYATKRGVLRKSTEQRA
jgi:hypothetical protein